MGNIKDSTPECLRNILPVGPPCTECDILGICGGRCLFSNQAMFWGMDWFNRICDTTRHTIGELEKYVPLARQMIDEGVLDITDLKYHEINNGCEIIP